MKPTPEPPPFRPGALLASLALAAVVWGAVALAASPPAPRPSPARAGEASAVRAYARLARILAEGVPHPVGSPAGRRVRERVAAEFRAIGIEPELRRSWVCGRYANCATVENLVGTLRGRDPDLPPILVATHHDSRGASPGASDDGVGVAAALEALAVLRAGAPLRRDVLLLVDDGEEEGLLGAEAFARNHPRAERVHAVINLEARGTSGRSLMFETSEGNLPLVRAYAGAVSRPATSSLLYSIYKRLPNDTDLTIFRAHGLRGMNLAYVGNPTAYHTPLDDLAHVDLGSLQHHAQNTVELARALDALDVVAGREDAVYFDVLGRRAFWWPARLAAVPAYLALALLLLLAVSLERAGWIALGEVLHALMGMAAGLVAGLVCGAAAHAFLGWLGAFPAKWVAHPAPALGAQRLAAVAGFALATRVATARARPWSLWILTWIGAAAVGAFLADAAPGVSYLPAVPALVAGVAGWAWRLADRRDPPVLLPWFVAMLVLVPLLAMLYEGLGLRVGLLQPLAAVLVVAPLLAGLRGVPGAEVGVVGLAAGFAGLLALAAPPFTPEIPLPLNLGYRQGPGEGDAAWTMVTEDAGVPAALAAAHAFRPSGRVTRSLKTTTPVLEAPAADLGLPAPVVVSRARRGDTWRLVLRSARGAPLVGLEPPRTGVRRIRVRGEEVAPRPGRWEPSGRVSPGDTLEVELDVEPGATLDLVVWDRSAGLPPGGEALLARRPPWAVPAHGGDTTEVRRAVRLETR